MSNLTLIEKRKLESLFGMGSGYVLDFTDRTFQELVLDSTGQNIFDAKYHYASGSKANRLRAFWSKEPDHVVGKLISDLLDYCKEFNTHSAQDSYECSLIAERLLQNAPVQDIEAIVPNAGGKDFEVLAKSVRDSIGMNEPESGLDRLHTFVVKYVRTLCEKHGITTDRNKPLHSLFGEYIKSLKKSGLIESEMAERILKSSISILEAFNQVRNERSFAHDNPVLSYSESLLIFNNVASSIRFIAAVEDSAGRGRTGQQHEDGNDIPF